MRHQWSDHPSPIEKKNSRFVDTLPSLYYDMLVVNAFMEFKDLMYSVGESKME